VDTTAPADEVAARIAEAVDAALGGPRAAKQAAG